MKSHKDEVLRVGTIVNVFHRSFKVDLSSSFVKVPKFCTELSREKKIPNLNVIYINPS